MIYFIPLFVEIIFLFLLSRSITKTLSKFLPISLMSLIFLPGVFIHEMSHMLMAVILFVPIGEMEFIPKKSGNGVKLGSIEIAKTDPIRRSIIGFAPVFAGLMIVIGIVYLFSSNLLFFQNQNLWIYISVILLLTYLLFAISNAMFSSKVDMEGAIEILIALFIIFIASYLLGFRPPLEYLGKIFTKELVGIIQKSAIFLLIPIIIDLLILGIIKLFTNSRSRSY